MNRLYAVAGGFGFLCIILSNSLNPPDAHTGAPGETFCTNCHTLNGSSNEGTISVEGFPVTITPEEVYTLTVVNRNTNDNAVRAGFQMTILGPTNTKAGDMSMPSPSSVVSMSGGRQYFEHSPAGVYPDSNVVKWTVQWKAPVLTDGSKITWFANGIIGNGNSKETGDRTVTSKGSGNIVVSATQDLSETKPTIYPNPGSDIIHIEWSDQEKPEGLVNFLDASGRKVSETEMHQGVVQVTILPPGMYLLEIRNNDKYYIARWVKI